MIGVRMGGDNCLDVLNTAPVLNEEIVEGLGDAGAKFITIRPSGIDHRDAVLGDEDHRVHVLRAFAAGHRHCSDPQFAVVVGVSVRLLGFGELTKLIEGDADRFRQALAERGLILIRKQRCTHSCPL